MLTEKSPKIVRELLGAGFNLIVCGRGLKDNRWEAMIKKAAGTQPKRDSAS